MKLLVTLALLGTLAACGSNAKRPSPEKKDGKLRAFDAPELQGLSAELTSVALATRPSLVRITNETHTLKRLDRWLEGLASHFGALFRVNPYYEYPYRVLNLPLYLFFGEFDFGDSMGSGWVVAVEDGRALVVTNAHVIENAARISCELVDGRRCQAQAVKVDEERDLALLRLEKLDPAPPCLRLRRSPGRPGEPILAVGFPGRDMLQDDLTGIALADERDERPNPTVTLGIVSAVAVELGNPKARYLQTDAALNHGVSGGPLLDLAGSVLGVADMMGLDAQKEGYALPVDALLDAFPGELLHVAPISSETAGRKAGEDR